MVKTKLIAMIVVLVAGFGSGGVWFFAAQDKADVVRRRQSFFGTQKQFDTIGGQDMRPRW